jgi:hypothetical protein
MTGLQKYAIEITKEICVARAGNSSVPINAENGKAMGDYFEQIYKKTYELVSKVENI